MSKPRYRTVGPDGTLYEVDVHGRMRPVGHKDMMFPVRCTRCSNVHDQAGVEVVGRYTDCSMWKCPGCDTLLDDRPRGWGGGSIEKLYK